MTVNLRTLDGINAVREDTMGKLLSGEIADTKAVVVEKMLRGAGVDQASRMKFLAMVMGNKRFDVFAAETAHAIASFVNGPAALTDGK